MKKKVIIIVLSVIIIFGGLGIYAFLTKEDKDTSLNVIEKKWIDNNKKALQDISIYTNIPIFSYNSEGIVFDFLKSLESDTGLEFNKISYSVGNEIKTDYAFIQTNEIKNNDINMFEDNYVLVTLNNKIYTSPRDMNNITVGVINDTMDLVDDYLLGSDITYKNFSSYDAMFDALDNDVNAIVVPKIQFLSNIIENESLTIGYNIDEYKVYFVLRLSDDNSNSTLNSILTKYYKKWSNENFDKSFKNSFVNVYFNSSENGSQNVAKLKSKRYVYGFVSNAPYDIMKEGELSGINNEIISNFVNISGISIEYKEYSDIEKMIDAFNSNEIDFFFNTNKDFEYKIDTYNTVSPVKEELVLLTKGNFVVNSINSLSGETVGVVKDSKISNYLSNYDINLREYSNVKKLMSDNKIKVKAIDNYNYNYFIKKNINGYYNAYTIDLNDEYYYTFRDISENRDFAHFMSFYLTYATTKSMINDGLINVLSINYLLTIVRVILVIIILIILVALFIFAKTKVKRKNNKKSNLSKGDKLKYVDMLTSLKNRNYLNDNMSIWDESEVYPQAIIVVDLNNIAYINDNYGHAEGDTVIKEAANVLIKNQSPNSEIIRTNGNEFLIYMVSYDEKQVLSYIKKLNKEFKELAHGFGAAMGYSMINDAIKTIDDAINEATIDMKNNKEEIGKD